jgi:hypothetical protein
LAVSPPLRIVRNWNSSIWSISDTHNPEPNRGFAALRGLLSGMKGFSMSDASFFIRHDPWQQNKPAALPKTSGPALK